MSLEVDKTVDLQFSGDSPLAWNGGQQCTPNGR